jgi:hypothetical protein
MKVYDRLRQAQPDKNLLINQSLCHPELAEGLSRISNEWPKNDIIIWNVFISVLCASSWRRSAGSFVHSTQFNFHFPYLGNIFKVSIN